METNLNTGVSPGNSYQQMTTLLGLSPETTTVPLRTAPGSNVLSPDESQSFIPPAKATLDTPESRTAFLSFLHVEAPNGADDNPVALTVYNTSNVTVTAGNPLIINPSEQSPVVVNIDTLILEAGGQIQCNTSVILNVTTFVKQ